MLYGVWEHRDFQIAVYDPNDTPPAWLPGTWRRACPSMLSGAGRRAIPPAGWPMVSVARWPREHTFYRPDEAGRHDPMLVAETMRQAGIAVAHAGYDVPFGTQFIMADICFYLISTTALIVGTGQPGIVVSLSCSEFVCRAWLLRRARFHVGLLRDGVRFAYGSGLLVCLPAGAYERLRTRRSLPSSAPCHRLPRVHPAVVGRR